jgi:hypothetical protein
MCQNQASVNDEQDRREEFACWLVVVMNTDERHVYIVGSAAADSVPPQLAGIVDVRFDRPCFTL